MLGTLRLFWTHPTWRSVANRGCGSPGRSATRSTEDGMAGNRSSRSVEQQRPADIENAQGVFPSDSIITKGCSTTAAK